jgi:hypothetical protein
MSVHSRETPHAYAINGTWRDTQFTARTFRFNDCVHQLVRTDNGIDGAGIAAMHATNTKRFVNNGNGPLKRSLLRQWQWFGAKQCCKSPDSLIAAGRAQVNRGFSVDDRLRIGAATRVTTLRALCLRQDLIDLVDECVRVGRQTAPCVSQGESGGKS